MTDQPEALILAEKLEEAAGDYSQFDRYLGHESAAMLREQHAEIERLRADAERYRWFRENALAMDTVADPDNFVQIWVGTDPASCFKARTLDAAIDAARAEERKP